MKTKATNSGYIIHARRITDAEKVIKVICHERQRAKLKAITK